MILANTFDATTMSRIRRTPESTYVVSFEHWFKFHSGQIKPVLHKTSNRNFVSTNESSQDTIHTHHMLSFWSCMKIGIGPVGSQAPCRRYSLYMNQEKLEALWFSETTEQTTSLYPFRKYETCQCSWWYFFSSSEQVPTERKMLVMAWSHTHYTRINSMCEPNYTHLYKVVTSTALQMFLPAVSCPAIWNSSGTLVIKILILRTNCGRTGNLFNVLRRLFYATPFLKIYSNVAAMTTFL
jgi:hypothetical protein